MADKTLKTRIILNNKTAKEWEAVKDSFKPLKGEFVVETDTRKIKIGDGATTYGDLSYATLTPEEVQTLIANASHSHNNKSILDATTASFTTALLEKLNGIAAGANKTIIDSTLSEDSMNPVQNKIVKSALDGKVPTTRKVNNKALNADITLTASDVGAIASTAKGAANGIASLGADGKVPSTQLPSYVDDVLEGYVASDLKTFYKDSAKSSAYTSETGKIYVDMTNNKTYRWSGSAYVVISETLAIGATSSTAFRGDYGKIAYDHSQSAHAPSNAEKNVIVGVQKNGTDVTVDSSTRKVNITVPTKTSDITNDSNFITSSANVASASKLQTARAIDGVNFNGSAAITHFGTCSTNAATAAKTVSLTGFSLVTGAKITIKFTVTNTATNPTLNVNGTGAKPIYYRGSAISTVLLAANRTYEFVYDGTSYNLVGDINTDTNTDTKVTQTAVKDSDYTNWRPLVLGSSNSSTEGFSPETVTDSVLTGTSFSAQPSTGTLKAKTFKGSLSGNSSSATKLATARNLSISGGATATAKSFNGTADVALEVTSLDATKLSLNTGDTLILDGSI